MIEERRHKRRVRMVSQLEVLLPSWNDPINAFSTNVSRNGVGFCCSRKVDQGSQVEIRITFDEYADEEKMQETIVGKVKWVKQISRIFEAGVEFQNLNRAQHPLLLKQVENL
jgi:hypothetical protein